MCTHTKLTMLALIASVCSCSGEDIPDARIGTVPAIDAAVASSPDARVNSGQDAPGTAKPDAPVAAKPDAPLQETPDAAVQATPDAAVQATPDAPPLETPDAATGAGAAKLIISEVAPNVSGSHDLIELVAVAGGTTAGIDLLQDYTGHPTALAHLPALDVAAGDVIVVHMTPGTVTTEAASKGECTDPGCYPGAWDVAGLNQGVAFTYHVIWLRDAQSAAMDVVPFASSTTTPPAAFVTDLPMIISDGVWKTACPDPCDASHEANLMAASVDWTNVDKTATGATVQRSGTTDTMMKADWQTVPATKANTIGAAN